MLKSLSLGLTSHRPQGNLLSSVSPRQPEDTQLHAQHSTQPSGTASNMSRIPPSSNLQDYLNTPAGHDCQWHCRQMLALLCTGRALPAAATEPATGQGTPYFQAGWQLLQDRCFSSTEWPKLLASFELKRRGRRELTFEHYLQGLAVTEIASWLPTTALQPDVNSLLAAAQAADHHCPNLQHTIKAVLWQPSPDRSETRQQLLDSAFFYDRLEKTICLLLRELRPWQHAEELKESNDYNLVFLPTLQKLTAEHDWDGVVAKYRAALAGGQESDFRAYYWKHMFLTAKGQLRPLIGRSPADSAQLTDSAQSQPDTSSPASHTDSDAADPDDFFNLMDSLQLTSRQQAVFLLRPWPMPAFAPCRARALKNILDGSADPRRSDELAERLHAVSTAKPTTAAPDREENTGKMLRDLDQLYHQLELAQTSKLHIFRNLFQRSSPDPRDRQLLLQRCLTAAEEAVHCTSLDQVRALWSPGAEAYSAATPGTRRPVNAEAQAKHDLKKFAESCYDETSARRSWLNTRIQLQATREKDMFRDSEIAEVLDVAVGTVEAAATQIRQAMKKPAGEGQQSLLVTWGFRDTAQELQSQLALLSLQQAVCSGLDLNHV